jgi:hypothetical protein
MPSHFRDAPRDDQRTFSGHAIATIESSIASAHIRIATAIVAASTLSDLGLHDDLQLIQLELERIQYSLLKGGSWQPRPRNIRA